MKYRSNYLNHSGMTLIEVVIYSTLLCVLLTGFLNYATTMHVNDARLINDIEDAYGYSQ